MNVFSLLVLLAHVFSNYTHDPNTKPAFLHTTTLPLWQAIMASCAAPGYFSQVVIDGTTHVDGAMVANNPTQLALLESKLLWPEERLQCLVSLGSGKSEDLLMEDNRPVSTKDLFSKSFDILADTETVHKVLRLLLDGEKYFRLNPPLQKMVELDECREELLEQLIKETERYISSNEGSFADVAATLMEQPSRVDRPVKNVREQEEAWTMNWKQGCSGSSWVVRQTQSNQN